VKKSVEVRTAFQRQNTLLHVRKNGEKRGVWKGRKLPGALGVFSAHFTPNSLLKTDAGFIDQVAFFG
jgi:hypothetical protein